MSAKVPTTTDGSGGFIPSSAWGVLAFAIGCAYLIRMGYDLGVGQSKKILKRHDKDFKRMEKREKRYLKEQKKKEIEQKKEQKGGP